MANQSSVNEIVQLYIPVKDIRESTEWYVNVFGFEIIHEGELEANLKVKQGPLLFLKKAPINYRLVYEFEGKEYPIISFKTLDINGFYAKLQEMSIASTEINTYGKGINGLYQDLELYDPNGHLIQVNSFPDLSLPKYRGY